MGELNANGGIVGMCKIYNAFQRLDMRVSPNSLIAEFFSRFGDLLHKFTH